MGYRTCAIASCKSGSLAERKKCAETGTKPFALFQIKQNKLNEWNTAVKELLKVGQFICEKHFEPHDILRTVEYPIADGTTLTFPRNQFILRNNAIPSKNLQSTHLIIKKKSIKKAHQEPVIVANYSLDDIKSFLKNTLLGSQLFYQILDDEVTLISIKSDNSVKCIFKIFEDLTVKAFTSDQKVSLPVENKVLNEDELHKVFKMMERPWCSGTGLDVDNRSSTCLGVIPLDKVFKKQMGYQRCNHCKTYRNTLQRRDLRKKKLEDESGI